MKRFAYLFGGLVLGLLVLGMLLPGRSTPRTRLSSAAQEEVITAVERAVAQGLLTTVDCTRYRAHITPIAWASMNAARKEAFTATVATYCGLKGEMTYITLYDAQTAKELGGFSLTGFYVK